MANYESGAALSSGGAAIPVTWTDDPIVEDSRDIPVKKVHLTEFRAALEALDGHYHVFNGNNSQSELPDVSVSWNEASVDIIVDQTEVKAEHVNEIIGFLQDFEDHYHYIPAWDVNSDAYSPGFTWTDDPVVTDETEIKKEAFEDEVRTYLEALAEHTHNACCECECQCTCTCTCTCQCQCDCDCDCTCDSHI